MPFHSVEFQVKITPAVLDEDGDVSHKLFDPRAIKVPVKVSAFPILEAHVRSLAMLHFPSEPVAVYVALPHGMRRLSGFKAAIRRFHIIQPLAE